MVAVLKDSNDLLNKLDQSNNMENIIMDIKQRDANQEQFNELFKENNIQDDSVDLLFQQFESEVHGHVVENVVVEKQVVVEHPQHNHPYKEIELDMNSSSNISMEQSHQNATELNVSSKSAKANEDENLEDQLAQLA